MPQYRDDQFFCGQLDDLAFLPTDDIPEGMMYIRGNTAPGAEGLVNYFDQTYVTGTLHRAGVPRDGLGAAPIVRMRRVPPRYPPALWNLNQASLDDKQITSARTGTIGSLIWLATSISSCGS